MTESVDPKRPSDQDASPPSAAGDVTLDGRSPGEMSVVPRSIRLSEAATVFGLLDQRTLLTKQLQDRFGRGDTTVCVGKDDTWDVVVTTFPDGSKIYREGEYFTLNPESLSDEDDRAAPIDRAIEKAQELAWSILNTLVNTTGPLAVRVDTEREARLARGEFCVIVCNQHPGLISTFLDRLSFHIGKRQDGLADYEYQSRGQRAGKTKDQAQRIIETLEKTTGDLTVFVADEDEAQRIRTEINAEVSSQVGLRSPKSVSIARDKARAVLKRVRFVVGSKEQDDA